MQRELPLPGCGIRHFIRVLTLVLALKAVNWPGADLVTLYRPEEDDLSWGVALRGELHGARAWLLDRLCPAWRAHLRDASRPPGSLTAPAGW